MSATEGGDECRRWVHFIDVGQGNMSLIECPDGSKFVVDCNITEANEDRVLRYVARQIGWNTALTGFICTHRDADHMRGVSTLHGRFPIGRIWDSGYPGTSTDTPEYRDYMALRRSVGSRVIEKKMRDDRGRTRFRYLSARDERLAKTANAQGIVLKVEHRTRDASLARGSTTLPGNSDAATWRELASSRTSSNTLRLASGSMRASAHAALAGSCTRASVPLMRRTAAAMSARSALLREWRR